MDCPPGTTLRSGKTFTFIFFKGSLPKRFKVSWVCPICLDNKVNGRLKSTCTGLWFTPLTANTLGLATVTVAVVGSDKFSSFRVPEKRRISEGRAIYWLNGVLNPPKISTKTNNKPAHFFALLLCPTRFTLLLPAYTSTSMLPSYC